jgi:hypothetical protein
VSESVQRVIAGSNLPWKKSMVGVCGDVREGVTVFLENAESGKRVGGRHSS